MSVVITIIAGLAEQSKFILVWAPINLTSKWVVILGVHVKYKGTRFFEKKIHKCYLCHKLVTPLTYDAERVL